MIEVTDEMKDLAKAAATAYVSELKITNMRESVESFLDAYDYALKKIWNKHHKDMAIREFASDSINDIDK